jgi:hypothetical protein
MTAPRAEKASKNDNNTGLNFLVFNNLNGCIPPNPFSFSPTGIGIVKGGSIKGFLIKRKGHLDSQDSSYTGVYENRELMKATAFDVVSSGNNPSLRL